MSAITISPSDAAVQLLLEVPMTVLGDMLREVRVRARLTQSQVAGLAGLTDATVSRIESGARSGSIETWRRLCAVLPVDAAVVLGSDIPCEADEPTEEYTDAG